LGDTLNLSDDEVQARLSKLEILEARDKVRTVDEKIREWQEAGFKEQPALLVVVRDIMLSDDEHTALLLSEHEEDGTPKGDRQGVTATEIVERLMGAAKPAELNLSEQHSMNGDRDRPDADTSKELSRKEKADAAREYLYPDQD
jgi:hypothetical protein